MNNENIYIGNRYVPIVVGEWDNSKTYEPLMVVLYQGNSYTSKGYVPAGIEISNSDYWVLSGNYNAQLEPIVTDLNSVKQSINTIDNSLLTINSEINTINSNITNINGTTLKGKHVLFIGDSIFAGITQGGYTTKTIAQVFEEKTGATCENNAVPGTCITNNNATSICARIKTIEENKYDIIFINGGINDWANSMPIGNLTTSGENTFAGALRSIIATAYAKIKTSGKVIIITPTMYHASFSVAPNSIYTTAPSYSNVVKMVCEQYNVDCIDGEIISQVNTHNRNTLIPDGTHFTSEGYRQIGETLAGIWGFSNTAKVNKGTNFIRISDFNCNYPSNITTWTYAVNGPILQFDSSKTQNFTIGAKYYLSINKIYTITYKIIQTESGNLNNYCAIIKNYMTNSQVMQSISGIYGITNNGEYYVTSTFKCNETGLYTLYFNSVPIGEGSVGTGFICDICMCEGNAICEPERMISNVVEVDSLPSGVSKVTINPKIKYENGNIYINAQVALTREFAPNEVIIPTSNAMFGKAFGGGGGSSYICGINVSTGAGIGLALYANEGIKTISTIPINTTVSITAVIPDCF